MEPNMKLNELLALKKDPAMQKELKESTFIRFLEQTKESHNKLVKKIENSHILYNRKESILMAVKRNFILSNKFEDTLDSAKKFKLNRSILIQAYMKEFEEVSKYTQKELDENIKDKIRLKRFNLCKWNVERIDANDLGVWPSFGGIDHFTTSGNLLDTKAKIEDLLNNTHQFTWPIKPNLPQKSIIRFILEKKHADLIYRFYPIIVTARGPNTRRVKANMRYQKFGFNYKIAPFDIEDGNHRAVAFVMFGIRKIKCFVGRGLVTDDLKEL